MSPSNDYKYKIVLKKRLKRRFQSLRNEIPQAMDECIAFLEESPENRLKSNGKLKKLKGRFKGKLQYDITNEARVRYEVDSKKRIVYIKDIGHHP